MMAAIDFPSFPNSGDQFVVGTITWTYDGTKWTAYPGVLSVPDAPSDGQLYGRQLVTGTMSWTPVGSGDTDAPIDNSLYGRKNRGWIHPTHLDITDWTVTLAPYALTANVPGATSTLPKMDGTATIGAMGKWADGDHVHPTDTSRYAANNPSGYQTAAQVTASLASYLPLAGGTMTGALMLAADPVAAMQPATKQYVDGGRLGDNRIINGDMRIDQRNNGANITTNLYGIDRWALSGPVGKLSWRSVSAGAGLVPFGFGYAAVFTSLSAYTPAAGESWSLYQPIEADMIADFCWGTASAQPVTLSFLAQTSLAGTNTFSGSIRNAPAPATRSYPFTFTLAAATWTKVIITIPPDTTPTWVLSGNAKGLDLLFDLGTGATYRAPAGAWANGNFVGANGAANLIGTNGATLSITGVKLEIGSVATPFNRQSLAKSMADCERYFRWIGFNMNFYASIAGLVQQQGVFFSAMRAAPTIGANVVDPNTTQNVANQSANSHSLITPYSARQSLTAVAVGSCFLGGYRAPADAEL